MYRRTARTNRILFAALGVLLLAVGGYLIARHQDWIDASGQSSHERLYSRAQAAWLHAHDWIWYAVAAAAIVVALLALRWLLIQPRVDRLHRLHLDPDARQRGRTIMGADVLTAAVEDDVVEYPGVDRARALLIGPSDAPEVVLRISAHPRSDLGLIRARLLAEALPALRSALDSDDVPVQVHLFVAGRRTARRVVL